MLAEAERDGFTENLMKYWDRDWKQGDPLPEGVQNLLEGVTRKSTTGLPKGTKFYTAENVEELLGPGSFVRPEDEATGSVGPRRWFFAYQKDTPQEVQRKRFEFYKTFAAMREFSTGRFDPLFYLSDVEGLAATDPDQIAVLKFKPAPGAMGFQMSALGEWRTTTGEAVELES